MQGLECPLPGQGYDRIVLGHGSGGRLSADLIREVFLPALDDPLLAALEDQAACDLPGLASRLAFTTDAFVVQPRFFPGGDIGRLAICGTVNDLAVGGAQPLYLSCAFVLEEGLPLAELRDLAASMRQACREAGVRLVAADTKVVARGQADGCFLTTTGVGLLPEGARRSIASARPGDRVLVSGTLGDHGMAVMAVREGLSFEPELISDCAPLNGLVAQLLAACPATRCMRDPTRGGLASTLNELALASRVGVTLEGAAIPVKDEVRGACELLGLDPLYVANEGKLVAIVPAADTDAALKALQSHPLGHDAAIIGTVTAHHPGILTVRSLVGGERIVPLLAGEQLPRIC